MAVRAWLRQVVVEVPSLRSLKKMAGMDFHLLLLLRVLGYLGRIVSIRLLVIMGVFPSCLNALASLSSRADIFT